ncbi:MAG: hypothetical protein ACKPA7_01445 [Sphaerospermopsis kisseleviana]
MGTDEGKLIKNMDTIETMMHKGINLFDTVTYKHNTGSYTCVVTKVKKGGIILRTVDNKDKSFFVYGKGLDNVTL